MFRGRFLHYLEQAFRAGELNFFSAHRHLHEPAAFLRYLAPVWNTECRVDGDVAAPIPHSPDVRNSRIRFFTREVRSRRRNRG